MQRSKLSIGFSLVLVAGIAMMSGCKSDPGRDRSTKAVTGLKDLTSNLNSISKDIDGVNGALAKLETGRDQKAAFDEYKKAVASMESEAVDVANTAKDMRERGAAYRTAWQEDSSKISDPELRAAAEKRAERVRERFNSVESKLTAVKEAWPAYKQQLTEVQTYLSNDLTPAAVKSASGSLKKTVDMGNSMKEKIAAANAELNAVTETMVPAK